MPFGGTRAKLTVPPNGTHAPAHYGCNKILIAPSCFFWKIS